MEDYFILWNNIIVHVVRTNVAKRRFFPNVLIVLQD